MTKEVDLPSAWGHTPPRLSICSSCYEETGQNAWGFSPRTSALPEPSPG